MNHRYLGGDDLLTRTGARERFAASLECMAQALRDGDACLEKFDHEIRFSIDGQPPRPRRRRCTPTGVCR